MQVLSNDCKIIKAYGAQNLYYHETTEKYFKTTLLQFICGKEYTFVLDIYVDESKVKIGEEILKLEISYEDIEQDNKKIYKEMKYKYELKDAEYIKANEEFTRAYVYYTLDEAIKLKDKNENAKGKKLLEDLEKWLSNNDKVKNEKYIKEINDAKKLFSEHFYDNSMLYNNLNCCVQNNMFKRMDIHNMNCNMVQQAMIQSISKQIPKSSNQNKSNNNNLFGNNNNNNYQYPLNMNSAPLFSNMNNNQMMSNSNPYMNPMMNNNLQPNNQMMNNNNQFYNPMMNNSYQPNNLMMNNNNQFYNLNNNSQFYNLNNNSQFYNLNNNSQFKNISNNQK